MAIRSRTVRSREGQRRLSTWLFIAGGWASTAGGVLTFYSSLDATAKGLLPFTVVRSRLLLTTLSDQIAASEEPFGAAGIIVVRATATALGVTALPGPISNTRDDWFVYQPFAMPLTRQYQTSAGNSFNESGIAQYEIDSKAMRKVDTGDDMAIMIETAAGDGARFNLHGRMLVKLH